MRRVLSAVLVLASASVALAEDSQSPLGTRIDGFELRDFRGKSVALSQFDDAKAVVVAFLGVDCPLARQYASRISELAAEFEPQGVVFLAIDSNQQDSVTEMASYAERYGLTIPFLKDPGNTVADRFQVERMPQAFVLDGERKIRYSGRIDDQYGFQTGTGYAKPKMKRRDLAEAVTEVVAGLDVSTPTTPVRGCLLGRVRDPDADSAVTYSNQVSRILQKHCVECHRPGQIAPFSLLTYADAAGWAEMIAEVVLERRMPPWYADPTVGHWRNDRRLSDEEQQLLADWASAGAPEGDPTLAPQPAQYSDEWALANPDAVYWMDDEPFEVPAEGVVEYQYYVVDPGFTEDKWVRMAECRPGDRSVVHHIIVFLQKPGKDLNPSSGRGELQDLELLHGTAPGMPPLDLPEGMAIHIPAGTKFVFQMHYTANGSPTSDRSSVAVKFADPRDVKQSVRTGNATNVAFEIPPGASSHPVTSQYKFARDSKLVWLMPHMHIRGKAFRYEVEYPDGRRETLLEVPRYDFNWQLTYEFAEPKHVPAGSTLHCLAHFDNSEDNLANPDPTKPVRWGDQTWEEMMIGWFGETNDVGPDAGRGRRFREALASGNLELTSRVRRTAKRALTTEASFQNLGRSLPAFMPQIDRLCVSYVDGDQLRFWNVSQSNAHDAPLGRGETTFAADQARLAELARSGQPAAIAALSAESAPDLSRFAGRFGSSVHIPLVVDGKPGTLNVWSTETDAFPPEAVKLLEETAELMAPR